MDPFIFTSKTMFSPYITTYCNCDHNCKIKHLLLTWSVNREIRMRVYRVFIFQDAVYIRKDLLYTSIVFIQLYMNIFTLRQYLH